MKMYFVEKLSEGDITEQLEALSKYFEFSGLEEADVIFCASILSMKAAMEAKRTTGKLLAVYCWDYYLWAHRGKHHNGWDWPGYADLLKTADIVFVPSKAQGLRLKELFDIDAVVVRSGIKTYDHLVGDDGFILDPVRFYPEENRAWAVNAAEKLGITMIHSEHQFSLEEFRRLVATCTFMTSGFREASTGGLTLIEGLWHGKPSLVSNSPYQGAGDYVGQFGTYFQYDNFDDLCDKMNEMWTKRKSVDIIEARNYINTELTFDVMAKKIYDSISSYRVVG